MITPIEIQSKTFKSGGLGYDKKDVDAFFREVLLSYEQIYRENMEMRDKISVLTEGIQYYKTIEKTLQKALVLAEKTAEDTKAQAFVTAKNIENEAMTRAQLIVADAKNELEHIHAQTIGLLQQYEKYKLQFKNLAAAQIELLESRSFDISLAKIETFVTVKDREENSSAEDNNRNINESGKPAEASEHKIEKKVIPSVVTKNNSYDSRVGTKNRYTNNKNHNSFNKNNINNNGGKKKQNQNTDTDYRNSLEQVSAASEEITLEEYNELMKGTSSYAGEKAEGSQDEFSFINLEDEED